MAFLDIILWPGTTGKPQLIMNRIDLWPLNTFGKAGMGYMRGYGKEVDQGLVLKIASCHLPGITEGKPWESTVRIQLTEIILFPVLLA